MKLVIVESPTKARTLERFLGGKYEIMASMGHVRDLPKSRIGVDTEHDFKPEYVVAKGKGETVKKIKSRAREANEIYLSMDPDREGEAIAYHVKKLIGGNGKFKRVVFHQITKAAIEEAFDYPRNIDLHLVDAQQARRVLDRLVGYTLSPVLWKKIRRGLSAGRVQSVAVRLVVEREREIEAFVSEEYWLLSVELSKQGEKGLIRANLIKVDGKKAEISNKELAEQAVRDLEGSDYEVEKLERKEVHRRPYPPFTTSTLQQSAANVLRFSAKRSMSLAQKLYEMGYITYHRTDSLNLADEAILQARKYIGKSFGKEYIPKEARRYKAKSKLAQEAHEAIRPTRVEVDEEKLKLNTNFQGDLRKLYKLIRRRFLASQMSDALYAQTKVDVKTAPKHKSQSTKVYLLRVTGSVLKFDGWQKLLTRRNEDVELPEMTEGELLEFHKVISEQKFTEPPARYTDATLIKALEEKGIGRPSTYAPTISTILSRQYVEYQDRKFVPTPVGTTTNDFLVENFKKEVDYDFTAKMEEDLDMIALGKRDWVPVVREFWKPFFRQVGSVEQNAKRVAVPTQSTGNKCPECKEGEVVIRVGKYGKFLSCSRFPECKYTKTYVEKLEGFKCPDDGGEVIIKRTRRGKSFYGCSNYPQCKWASWKKPRSDQ